MLPLLSLLADGNEQSFGHVVTELAWQFEVSADELAKLLPSGRYPFFRNRVGWASTYLAKALLIERPRRGYMVVTDRGLDALKQAPMTIDAAFLAQFPEWQAFQGHNEKAEIEPAPNQPGQTNPVHTPEEVMEEGFRQFQASLADDLLRRARQVSPAFFEQLVVRLLVAMGYGGSFDDAAQVVGKTGDGGIDGVIKEDRLGLDAIYVQAKRWQSTVGQPIVAEFVGNLAPHRANKGVLITTSLFSTQAKAFVKRIGPRVVLIDGPQLADLMMEHGVGVTPNQTYVLQRDR